MAEREHESAVATAMLTIWSILLVIGAPLALMGTGMAFEGGHTFSAWLFLAAVWSYPPLILISFCLRKRWRLSVRLPAVPVSLILLSTYFNW